MRSRNVKIAQIVLDNARVAGIVQRRGEVFLLYLKDKAQPQSYFSHDFRDGGLVVLDYI